MNCKEFKQKFKGRIILAFVVDTHTHLYRFHCEYITEFMRRIINTSNPNWELAFFYTVESFEDNDIERVKSKAQFLFCAAKSKDQRINECVFKEVIIPPNMTKLEGKRMRMITLRPDKK